MFEMIKSLLLAAPFFQAGLVGYSDRPMRVVARRRGCPYAVTEALLDHFVADAPRGVRRRLVVHDDDHPLAGQIMGGDPSTMARAARVLVELGHDVIDVNMACPVRKQSRARGGHLLEDPDRAGAVLRAVRDAVPGDVPTTVKLRKGTDARPGSVERLDRILETAWDAGYAAVCVHGRTVDQGYRGPADWGFLAGLRERHPGPVMLGSGDLFCAGDALRMLEETRLDGACIARGAIGNPWIFQDLIASLDPPPGEDARAARPPPTIAMQRDAIHEHLALALATHGATAARRMRGVLLRYARFHPDGPAVRSAFLTARTAADVTGVLEAWYRHDGPGFAPPPAVIDEVNGREIGADDGV